MVKRGRKSLTVSADDITPSGTSGLVAKKLKTETQEASVPEQQAQPWVPSTDINAKYYQSLLGELTIIEDRYPGIRIVPPLTLAGAVSVSHDDLPSYCKDLFGFAAPFDADQFDLQYEDAKKSRANFCYSANMNFFWISPYLSVTPGVPLYETRVKALGLELLPNLPSGAFQYPSEMCSEVETGVDFLHAKCSLKSLSPSEIHHSIISRFADFIRNLPKKGTALTMEQANAEQQWLRFLLSWPVIIKFYESSDAQWARLVCFLLLCHNRK